MEKITGLKKNICIVSNDAGGAEILNSFIRFKKKNFKFILDGPALKIFKKKKIKTNYKKIIDKSEIVITGTSSKSNLELKCIRYCNKNNKEVYSFLDHWVNYKTRFIRGNKYVSPKKIIVGDKFAKEIANKYFKKVVLVKNPYWVDLKFKTKVKRSIKNNILYVSSNVDRIKKKILMIR